MFCRYDRITSDKSVLNPTSQAMPSCLWVGKCKFIGQREGQLVMRMLRGEPNVMGNMGHGHHGGL